MPVATLRLPPLHAGQQAAESLLADVQVLVLPCGRRWGKSDFLIGRGVENGWCGKRTWLVEPTYKIGTPVWGQIVRFCRQLERQRAPIVVRETDRSVIFPESGGEYRMRSADDPDGLVAEGLDEAQIDEAGLHVERTWDESLEPTLIDRRGKAIIAGVPKGTRGLLYAARQRAIGGATGYALLTQTTFDNPALPADRLQQLRERHERGEIPERYWRQEYLAEFLPADGVVFEHVLDCATAPGWDGPRPGKTVVFGVDWGKRNDWTVVSGICLEDREQVFLERWRGIEYVQGRGRLLALAQHWRPLEIVAEVNAMGDPILEELEREGLPIRRFTTTSASKAQAVDALALAFAQQSIRIIADPVQVAELQAYEAKPLPSGATRYQAPGSGHDDTVSALWMAWSSVDAGEGGIFAGP